MDARAFALALALGAGVRLAAAQEPPQPPADPPSFEELQAMIARMQQRVESLGQTAAERDKALKFLSDQVDKAAGQISGTGETNDSLRGQTAVLSDQLTGLSAERDRLAGEAQTRAGELDQIRSQIAMLEQALGTERTGKAGLEQELGKTRTEVSSLRTSLEGQQRAAADATQALGQARLQIAALNDALEEERKSGQEAARGRSGIEQQLQQARTAIAALSRSLEEERGGRQAATDSFGKELEAARAELATLRRELEGERKASAGSGETLSQARLEVANLTRSLEEERSSRQAAADGLAAAQERVKGLEQALAKAQEVTTAELDRLRSELKTARGESEALKARLAGVESAEEQKETRIADLDRQLKEALAQQVEELSQYRSEFFGRLRQLLGDRQDIRVVGDRFVFQSELLFASGSATLDPEGTAALRELAKSLREVAGSIPSDLDWVLRVDGHTDRLPIRVGPFVSNWELSAARAISVVEFLVREGSPPDRLAAAGFGEFRPLDTRDDEIAYRRNRRIEFKLTEG
jgi:chemotaxis protein MotB